MVGIEEITTNYGAFKALRVHYELSAQTRAETLNPFFTIPISIYKNVELWFVRNIGLVKYTDNRSAQTFEVIDTNFLPVDPGPPDAVSNNGPLATGLQPFSGSTDTDGDGIFDINEIGDPVNPVDSDLDGVMDALEHGTSSSNNRTLGFVISSINATVLGIPQLNGELIQITGDAPLMSEVNSTTALPIFTEEDFVTSDSEYDFPLGIFTFSANVSSSTLNITIQFPANVDIPADAVLRKLNSSSAWQTIESAVFDRNLNTVSFSILDNGPLDRDSSIGSILDPVGIGIPNQQQSSPPSASTSGTGTGGGGGGGCSLSRGNTGIDPTLLLICFVFALLHHTRRRKHN